MKKISILLIITLLCGILSACGEGKETAEPATRDMLDAAMALFTDAETNTPTLYYSDAEEGSDNYLDEGVMSYYFLGEYDAEIPELQMVEEYALAMPAGLYAFEIDIFKAKSASAANEVKALLSRRLDEKAKKRGELKNYDAAQVPILDGCEVYTSGKYVILIATGDNSGVKSALSELLSSDQLASGDDGDTASGSNKIADAVSHVNDNLTGGSSVSVGHSQSDDPSEVPVMTITSYSGNNLIILGGSCVEGAKIHVRGEGIDKVFGTDYNSWLVEVQIASEGVTNLSVTQEEPDKGESEPIVVTVQARTDVDLSNHGVCQVAFGDNMQGHFFGQFADWTGTNLMSDKQVEGVTSRIKDKVDYLNGLGCELVYLIVPNPIAIYPETAPERYERSTADTSRTEQFENAAIEAGATVIDLYDLLLEHRDDEFKIFHKTDSHWTDYGAYWGYTALMDYISESWPDAAPLGIDGNFEFYHEEVIAGDMMTHLEIDNKLLTEYDSFVRWNIPAVSNPPLYKTKSNELVFDPVSGTKTVKNNISEGELPTAMIIRDSFSTNMYGYLNNAFSAVYWQSMWDYKFDKGYIERTNPDYYIILIAERNIGNVLG